MTRKYKFTPSSGEIVLTDREWSGDDLSDSDYFYTEVAKRFFALFLEMKQERQDGVMTEREVDKELARYKKAIKQMKEAAEEIAAENSRLSEALALAENDLTELRAKYNEAIMDMGRLQEKLKGLGLVQQREQASVGYSFVEHMSEESRRTWEQIMREIPRPGGADG